MKQTNNAIKFLMAQYRAIFKNAYFKGIASAVLLTAGLAAAGSAKAAANDAILDEIDFVKTGTANNQNITQNSEIDLGDFSSDKFSGTWTSVGATVIDGAHVSITGETDRHIAVSGGANFTIQNGGSLTITNTNTTNTTLYGGADDGNSGSFIVTGDGSTANLSNTSINFNTIEVKDGASVTFGGMVQRNWNTDKDKGSGVSGDWHYYTGDCH